MSPAKGEGSSSGGQDEGGGGLVGGGDNQSGAGGSSRPHFCSCLPSPLFSKDCQPHPSAPRENWCQDGPGSSETLDKQHTAESRTGVRHLFHSLYIKNLSPLNVGGFFFSCSSIFSEDASNASAALQFPRLGVRVSGFHYLMAVQS